MEKIVSQILRIVKSKYSQELLDRDNLNKIEKVFKRVLDEITAKSLKKYLEEYDQELRLDNNRNKNYVVQRTVSKSITSILGTFRLNRTKYYDKENDCYFCLLDRKLNIPEYEHMTPLAMARMLEVITNSSYRIAGREINSSDEFSKGMIYHKLKRLEIDEQYEERRVKKKVKVLYINLDEDHVAVQKSLNKKLQCKIGYVYENVIKVCKNRYKLTNKHTICGTYLKSNILKCLYENNKEMLIDLIDDGIELSNKRDKMIQTRDYLLNNWKAIQRTLLSTDESGCSAEGNVSHILSARLSQKGMGWCEHNADAIGKLRGIQSNDGEEAFTRIAEIYYYQRTHYCKDSEVIKYTHRANEYYDINKSCINRLQTTIPDYYMNKKILENKYINY